MAGCLCFSNGEAIILQKYVNVHGADSKRVYRCRINPSAKLPDGAALRRYFEPFIVIYVATKLFTDKVPK
jgi:hypothetical protein